VNVTGVHHLTLSVTDVEASAEWYQRLLGPATVVRREGPGWTRVRMAWPSGVIVGVTAHEDTYPDDRFDHTRVGLDHVGLACPTEADVRAWAAHMDEAGITRGPVEDVPYGWAVTARDPDGIAIEFFCSKPS
jgi:glyoxylase I family protein